MSSGESQSIPYTSGDFTTYLGVVSATDVNAAMDRVKQFTAEIFSQPFECVEQEDWEAANDRYFEFRVIDDGEVDDILARIRDWHRRVIELPSNVSDLFRLSVGAED